MPRALCSLLNLVRLCDLYDPPVGFTINTKFSTIHAVTLVMLRGGIVVGCPCIGSFDDYEEGWRQYASFAESDDTEELSRIHGVGKVKSIEGARDSSTPKAEDRLDRQRHAVKAQRFSWTCGNTAVSLYDVRQVFIASLFHSVVNFLMKNDVDVRGRLFSRYTIL